MVVSVSVNSHLIPSVANMQQNVLCAFQLAVKAACSHIGDTAPNPPVGCAILDEHGYILAVGSHCRAGLPHAEIVALEICLSRGLASRMTTAVVTLEPCQHHGRTGPCTEALINSGIKEVWIGVTDPNLRVRGKGVARLEQAGVSVRMLESLLPGQKIFNLCQALVAPFESVQKSGRPWITVKQAITETGSMIPPSDQKTFTSPQSLLLAHQLRRATEAIITGSGTILCDNPQFTVRHLADHKKSNRLLIICDRRGRVCADYIAKTEKRGFRVEICKNIEEIPKIFADSQVLWAVIEAGPLLLKSIGDSDLWDDWLSLQCKSGFADTQRLLCPRGISPVILLDGFMAT